MLYAVICTDKPGALELRKANREAHLAYIAESGVVAMAGPFVGETGDMQGSLVVLDVDSREAAEAWAENDPYAKGGLFSDVRIEAWNKVIG